MPENYKSLKKKKKTKVLVHTIILKTFRILESLKKDKKNVQHLFDHESRKHQEI